METIRAKVREARESEISVLGAVLLDPKVLDIATGLIDSESFHRPHHATIYAAMCNLWKAGVSVDPVIVADELDRTGKLDEVGGTEYILFLSTAVVTTVNIEHHINLVREASLTRKAASTLKALASRADEGEFDDLDGLIQATQEAAFDIGRNSAKTGAHTRAIPSVLEESLRDIQAAQEDKRSVRGIPTGFVDVDLATTGFRRGEISILAARPAMGKTALAVQEGAQSAELTKEATVIFSLEMPAVQLGNRLISCFAEVNAEGMRTGFLFDGDAERINLGVQRVGKIPLYVNDRGGLTVADMRAELSKLDADPDVPRLGLIVVDYLQIVRAPRDSRGRSREQEVAQISADLLQMAKDFDVHVMALSQLNRGLESRPDKRPLMSDLRESGSLEQDASLVRFLYRPEVYKEDSELKGLAEVVIGKNRHGMTRRGEDRRTGSVRLTFIKEYVKFANYAWTTEV